MQWNWPEKANVNEMMDRLILFAEHKGYAAQKVGRTGNVLEISKGGLTRQCSGLSGGLRLVVTVKQDKTMVDVSGHGKEYAMKAAVGGVSFLFPVLLPLAATAAYGACAATPPSRRW